MKHLIIISLLALTACAGDGSSPAAGVNFSPNPTPGAPVTRDVVVSTGHNYACTLNGNSLLCWGNNPPLGIPAQPTVIISGATITDLHLYDYTICIGVTVGRRPVDHAAGAATYCFGNAAINNGPFAGQPVLFSPPVQQSDISTELITWTLPYSASDLPFTSYMSLGTVLDSSNDVTSSTVTCTQNGTAWDCGSFTL